MPLARINFAVRHFLLSRVRSTVVCMVVAASLIIACSGDDLVLPNRETPTTSTIQIDDGDGQTGQVGEMLEFPIEVLVTDAEGGPVYGATVVFELTSAGQGGQISPSPTTTNPAGKAQAQVRLGDKVGLQTGAAHVIVDGGTGSSATFSAHAEPPGNPHNDAPRADYNWHCEGRACQFTNASSDRDGNVVRWEWSFGDGATSDQAEPLHLYPGSGEYTVTLVVTDDRGATDETTAHVEVED